MRILLITATITVVAFILYLVIWRLLSRFFNLPCPAFYIGLLESAIFDRIAGAKVLIERADIQPGHKVLDAGCGPGRVTLPLAEYLGNSGQVTAFDMQDTMLSRLRARLKEKHINNVKIIHGRFGENLLPEATHDRALMVSVLGEIPDQVEALREIYRSLVPGGILSITETLPDPHYQTPKKVTQLAEEVGFKTILAFHSWRSYTINLTKLVSTLAADH
jgi:ubiquinone/menaquinone biosynthesis C-methylase UbiE